MAAPGTYQLNYTHARHKHLSSEVEAILVARIKTGDRAAADRLVLANMKFVIAVARQYTGRGVPFEDLIGEGALGLARAALRFDPLQTGRFISYAVWWVRQAMEMCVLKDSATIRTPAYFPLTLALRKAEKGGDPVRVAEAREAIDCRNRMRKPESFDELHGAGFDLEDEGADPSTEVDRWDAAREVARYLTVLDPMDQSIIRRYFGLDDGETETLEEVGARFGMTREAVRQRKAKALYRLRVRSAKGPK